MNEFSPAEFLRHRVYPKLDAVESGLLNGLDPKNQKTSGSYPLKCPACGSPEGFYFPFSGYINCPRKKQCGRSTSVWDAMIHCGYSNREIFSLLCSAAGVEPPKRDQKEGGTATPTNGDLRIGQAIKKITIALAKQNPGPLKQFQSERGYTDEQMAAMGLGFYTTPGEVMKELEAAGFSVEQAAACGYIEYDEAKPEAIWSGLTGRIVGYWPHPDGDVRLWGRLPTGSGTKSNPKYKFGISLKKDIPYLFNRRQPTILVCVEGTMDAWALQLAEIWGNAVGGSSINSAQAAYLCGRGIPEVAHMVDGDNAGWNGAVGSIRNCESAGIVTSIIPLGAGMDDADALLRAGKADELKRFVEKRINSGKYLALMLRSAYAQENPDLQAISRIFAAADCLTSHSRAIFEQYRSLLGPRIDLEQDAARMFSFLITSGVSLPEAVGLVRRRTGHVITIAKEANDA